MDLIRKNLKLNDMLISVRRETQDAAEESLRADLAERVSHDEYLRILGDPKFFDDTIFLIDNLYGFMKFVFHYLWHKKQRFVYNDNITFTRLYALTCETESMIAKNIKDYTNRYEVDEHIALMKAVSEHIGNHNELPKLKAIIEKRMKLEIYEEYGKYTNDLQDHLRKLEIMRKDICAFR